MTERPAIVSFRDTFAERPCEHRVLVVGETPQRYRVRWLEPSRHWGNWHGAPGETSLVPKAAVQFEQPPAGDAGAGEEPA